MGKLVFLIPAAMVAALSLPAQTYADDAASSLPNGAVGMTFHFSTSVKTPQGQHGATGTIVLRSTGPSQLSLTVSTTDGSSKTIPLVVKNGSVQPAQTPAPDSDSTTQGAAKALMANMKLAATIGGAARKSSGQPFEVPVTLTPVGQGTPVPAQLAMTPSASQNGTSYAGQVQGTTTTQLPQSGGMNPEQLAKSVGVGVAPGVSPWAKLAIHHRTEEQKKAASGPLSDTVTLSVQSHFAGGRFHDISGQQTDALKIGNKPISIVSSWSFTKAGSE